MGIGKAILIIVLILAVVYAVKPEVFGQAGEKIVDKGVEVGKQAIIKGADKLRDTNETEKVIEKVDLGLPYLNETGNFTFILCTSDNICERLFQGQCNITTGHCFLIK